MVWMAVGMDLKKSERVKDRAKFLGVLEGAPIPLILGRHLIALGVKGGPEVGKWVDLAYEAQLDGEFNSESNGIDWISKKINSFLANTVAR